MTDPTPLPNPNPAPLPPTPIQAEIQAALDADRLKLLEIGYYISGIVTAVFVSFLLLHFCLFLFFAFNPQFFNNPHGTGHQGTPPPPGLFLGLAGFIGLVILLGWLFGALQVIAGRCLKKRQHLLFVTIIAALECCFIP